MTPDGPARAPRSGRRLGLVRAGGSQPLRSSDPLVSDLEQGGTDLAGPGEAVVRHRQAQVAAQGGGLVLGADDAALLQDRDDLGAESAPLAGVADADVETVERAGLEPLLDL